MKKYVMELILLAISGMFLWGIGNADSKEALKAATEEQHSEMIVKNDASGNNIIVYYFHRTYRCPSCLQIEAWSLDAIQERFAQALEQGTIIWETIDVDKPENSHFTKEYQLSTQALIVVEMTGKKQKRYKNLEKVWQYLSDQQAFYEYVTQEINRFLSGS